MTWITRNTHLNKRALWNRTWPLLIIILAGAVVMLPQLISGRTIVGEDCWFHMNRAYEDMMQIKTGHYSYFMNLFSFDRSGRIVNGLYGPAGGYLEGLLLLLVRTWYRWEIVNSLIVLIVSGASMDYVARKLGSRRSISLLVGLFYMTSFPFDRWVIGQNFDGFGAMLIPWFMLAGYRIFRHRFSSVKLALLVAIVAQVHLMSTLIGVVYLLISFVIANCYSGRLKVWRKVMLAAALAALLTVNVWGALLEVETSSHLVPTIPYRGFLTLRHAINGRYFTMPISNHVIVELLILLIVGIILAVVRHADLRSRFFAIQGLVFTWLASVYFPWALVIKHFSMVTSYLQFPERFLPVVIASVLLTVAGTDLKAMKVPFLTVVGFLVVINAGFGMFREQATVNNQYHSLMVSNWNVSINRPVSFRTVESALRSKNSGRFIRMTNNKVADYMPFSRAITQSRQYYRARPDNQNIHNVIANPLAVHHSVAGRDVTKMTFTSPPHRKIRLPFVKYAHTQLWLNHRRIDPPLDQLRTVKPRPNQRHNVLEAQYRPSRWYETLAWVEVGSWLILMISLILIKIEKR